jgi:hypothetical protein
MTTLEIIVMTAAYAAVLLAVVYFSRPPALRFVGALTGGFVAGCLGLGAMALGQACGVWQISVPSTPGVWLLFYVGLSISLTPIYLVTWRIARKFGWRGLAVCLVVVGVIGPPRDYLYAGAFPKWMVFGHGVAPVIADAATYVAVVAVGHVTMWWVSGPARASRLARERNAGS